MDIEKIVRHFGSEMAVAKAIGTTRQSIYQWRVRGFVPKVRQFQLEVLTNGKLRAQRADKK